MNLTKIVWICSVSRNTVQFLSLKIQQNKRVDKKTHQEIYFTFSFSILFLSYFSREKDNENEKNLLLLIHAELLCPFVDNLSEFLMMVKCWFDWISKKNSKFQFLKILKLIQKIKILQIFEKPFNNSSQGSSIPKKLKLFIHLPFYWGWVLFSLETMAQKKFIPYFPFLKQFLYVPCWTLIKTMKRLLLLLWRQRGKSSRLK